MCLTCCDIGSDVQDDNDGGVDFDGENYSNGNDSESNKRRRRKREMLVVMEIII